MANKTDVESLMQVRLKKEARTVQDLARQLGVSYALSPHVSQTMSDAGIDKAELPDFIENARLVEFWNLLGVARYRLESDDPDQLIASVTVSLHHDSLTIEVVALRVKEKQS